jgi:predicted nucleotidyltransferase
MENSHVIDIEQIKSILRNHKSEFQRKYKAEILGIFGSYSRYEADKNSDIDLLVRFHKGASLFGWAGFVKDLEKKLGVSVDVVPENSLKKELRPQVEKDLIEI